MTEALLSTPRSLKFLLWGCLSLRFAYGFLVEAQRWLIDEYSYWQSRWTFGSPDQNDGLLIGLARIVVWHLPSLSVFCAAGAVVFLSLTLQQMYPALGRPSWGKTADRILAVSLLFAFGLPGLWLLLGLR